MSDTRANEAQWVQNSDKEEVEEEEEQDNGRSAKKAAAELSLRVHLLSWINRMINLCKDLAIMLLVAFTYAALMNE